MSDDKFGVVGVSLLGSDQALQLNSFNQENECSPRCELSLSNKGMR